VGSVLDLAMERVLAAAEARAFAEALRLLEQGADRG